MIVIILEAPFICWFALYNINRGWVQIIQKNNRIDLAFNREKQLQGWSRKKKEALIKGWVEELHQLASCKNETHYLNQRLKDPSTIPKE